MPNNADNSARDNSMEHKESVVYRVGVKVPPFWPDKPSLWFAQLDGQFALSNITSDTTKFYHVISVLEPRYASEVEDIIINPPETNKYEALKQQLIARLSASRSEQLKQLMMKEELGDRKPSQFFRHIRSQAGADYPDEFIRTLWSSRLPTLLQSIIATQEDMPLEKLALLADKIQEAISSGTSHVAVASTSSSSSSPAAVTVIDELSRKIEALSKKIDAMSTHQKHRGSRARSKSRNQREKSSRSRSRPGTKSLCWYHFKFGEKAAKCISPCSFISKN